MLSALKFLFTLVFYGLVGTSPVVVEHQIIEADEIAKEVQIEIEDIRPLKPGEAPDDILELKVIPKAKVEVQKPAQ